MIRACLSRFVTLSVTTVTCASTTSTSTMDSPGTPTKSISDEFQGTWMYAPRTYLMYLALYSYCLYRTPNEFELERIAHDLEKHTTTCSFQRLLRYFLSLLDYTTTTKRSTSKEEDEDALKSYIDAMIPLANQLRPHIAHL